jgi:hypothetical protein
MISNSAFCKQLDPKGFWRIDKDQDPELRHTVLSLAAFDDLQRAVAAAGSRDSGIEAWCSQNDGDGWMLPETLCIADLGLTRTVALEYDERAKTPQPVFSRMGERFLDWQLAQTLEESWAECERHAKALGATAAAASPLRRSRTPAPRLAAVAGAAGAFADSACTYASPTARGTASSVAAHARDARCAPVRRPPLRTPRPRPRAVPCRVRSRPRRRRRRKTA